MNTPALKVPVRPLHVETDGAGRYRQAFCVDDLATLLLGGWPQSAKTDPAFHRALATSLDAMELYVDAETAREAFVDAARTAGMTVLPDDMGEIRKTGRQKKPRRGWQSESVTSGKGRHACIVASREP